MKKLWIPLAFSLLASSLYAKEWLAFPYGSGEWVITQKFFPDEVQKIGVGSFKEGQTLQNLAG